METIPEYENPIDLFREWYAEARACEALKESSAVVLSTVDGGGMPSSRVVLLKGLDDNGFVIYTNLGSTKAQQLAGNPKAALNFYWMPLDKQVRVSGVTEPVTDEEADTYFSSRPRESQLGAWASRQSEVLDDRVTMVERYQKYLEKYEGGPVPRPEFWSGFRLKPETIEFWLAHPFRLHERRVYRRNDDGTWPPSQLLYP